MVKNSVLSIFCICKAKFTLPDHYHDQLKREKLCEKLSNKLYAGVGFFKLDFDTIFQESLDIINSDMTKQIFFSAVGQ